MKSMDKPRGLLSKTLVIGTIFLLIGTSTVPANGAYATTSTTLDDNGSLSGYVNDIFGNPIEGALVRVYFHETYEEDYSDSSGFYHVTNISICWCMKNTTCSKEGYKTEWVLLSIAENTTYDFVLTSGNNPPDAPKIEGPRRVKPGTYDFSFKAIDPDGDNLFYYISWDDDTFEEWVGPYLSSESVTINHTFTNYAMVIIRAKVKDIYNAESDWSTFDIKIQRTREINLLFTRLLERYPFLEVLLRIMNQ